MSAAKCHTSKSDLTRSTMDLPTSARLSRALRCTLAATQVGAVVRRIARDANNELSGNVRYEFSSGHSNVQAASISDQTHIFRIGTNASLLPSGAVGHVYAFDDAIPAAAGYSNGDVGIVEEGADRGVWVKDSVFQHGAADTGWAGKTISTGPTANLQPVDVASGSQTFRHWRWGRRGIYGSARHGADCRRRRVAWRDRVGVH